MNAVDIDDLISQQHFKIVAKNLVEKWILGVENTIRIDAGTNPYAQSRFCLGRIANNKRNKMIEQVRTSIGRGIELSGGHQHSRGIFTLTSLKLYHGHPDRQSS